MRCVLHPAIIGSDMKRCPGPRNFRFQTIRAICMRADILWSVPPHWDWTWPRPTSSISRWQRWSITAALRKIKAHTNVLGIRTAISAYISNIWLRIKYSHYIFQNHYHYSEIIWVLWRVQSWASRKFIRLFRLTTKNIKALHCRPSGNPLVIIHNSLLIRNAFSFADVIICKAHDATVNVDFPRSAWVSN